MAPNDTSATGTAPSGHSGMRRNADGFMKSIYRLFDGLAQHARGMVFILLALVAVLVIAAALMGKREKTSSEARNALFIAQKQYETELKALLPPAPAPAKVDDKKKDPKKPAPATPPQEDVEFKALDVSAKLPGTVKAYREVIERFPDTRAAYDARMALGHLFLQHGQPAMAEEWLNQATTSAPRGVERQLSLAALGYAREGQGKLKEAVESFNAALATGEDAMKGDVMMALARCYEGLKDLTNAKATYEKVIAQLPNSEYARNAELYRSQVQ